MSHAHSDAPSLGFKIRRVQKLHTNTIQIQNCNNNCDAWRIFAWLSMNFLPILLDFIYLLDWTDYCNSLFHIPFALLFFWSEMYCVVSLPACVSQALVARGSPALVNTRGSWGPSAEPTVCLKLLALMNIQRHRDGDTQGRHRQHTDYCCIIIEECQWEISHHASDETIPGLSSEERILSTDERAFLLVKENRTWGETVHLNEDV